jgi:hypothetical protein
MISEIKMFECTCDNCGEQWQHGHDGFVALADEDSLSNTVSDDEDWHTDRQPGSEPDKHYCPDCFHIDDEDNLIIKPLYDPKE